MKKQLLWLVVLLLPVCAIAQERVEYGSTAELQGVTKIFIYTGANLTLRDDLREKITRKLPNLIITDSADQAEVFIAYSRDNARLFLGVMSSGAASTAGNQTTANATSMPLYRSVQYGNGLVAKRGESGTMRLLMNWKGTKKGLLQKGVVSKFAAAFVKAYLKANE